MNRRALALIAALIFGYCAVLAVQVTPAAAQPAAPPPDAGAAETPCLGGDPFNLSTLRDVISADVPPSSPVTINQHMLVTYMGAGTWMTPTTDAFPPDSLTTGNPAPAEPAEADTHYGTTQFRVFNTRTQFMFRVSLSEAMLKAISTCHEQSGRTSASSSASDFGAVEGLFPLYLPLLYHAAGTSAAVPDQSAPNGWSNGTDTRIVFTPTTKWPWRTITEASLQSNNSPESLCTMTLIGPRHMITAAHCLVNFGTSAFFGWQLTPGRDGINVKPYGSTSATPNPPPGHKSWYFVPDSVDELEH